HRVQAVERVHHSRSEVDEPDERRAPALQLRDDRLIELLDERDFVRDARPVEGLRGDRAARDPVRVDVRHDADKGRCAHALRDLLGDRIVRPIHRPTRAEATWCRARNLRALWSESSRRSSGSEPSNHNSLESTRTWIRPLTTSFGITSSWSRAGRASPGSRTKNTPRPAGSRRKKRWR